MQMKVGEKYTSFSFKKSLKIVWPLVSVHASREHLARNAYFTSMEHQSTGSALFWKYLRDSAYFRPNWWCVTGISQVRPPKLGQLERFKKLMTGPWSDLCVLFYSVKKGNPLL